ncbi:Tad domain-containing protein [Mesobacterium sp. TK19101]|uniref:Tad domain-containing protein n=1 Tax=Mesobacterium hydrothermale TaxID=3111907 RepID=A0ABU6HEZ4_9RHOB|nr:Tad domain-containing protein [Mesobacterium sp. TK19101]MEC3860244.1 Tad domain-containing protein [Mesobacterium sp. TK19101]
MREESGSMTHMALATIMIMMAFGGIGIDMIHAELKRTRIQATLDRAVLAGAALDNELGGEEVVEDYFAKMGIADTLVSVDDRSGVNFRRVSAVANDTLAANFSQFIGVDHFEIDASGTAEQQARNVEISLVLDISASMGFNNRLPNLQDAAEVFLDTVMDDTYPDAVSVSLVPYSEHVSVGLEVARHMNVDWEHPFSFCIEMPDNEVRQADLDLNRTYDQAQAYQWNLFGSLNDLDTPVCPNADWAEVTPLSNDHQALVDQINAFVPQAGTSIFLGMKWGVALLDPSARPLVRDLADDGIVPNAFRDRPMNYGREDTMKHIVLMTDGENGESYRISSDRYDPIVASLADVEAMVANGAAETGGMENVYSCSGDEWWKDGHPDCDAGSGNNTPFDPDPLAVWDTNGDGITASTWSGQNFWYFLVNFVLDPFSWGDWYQQKYSQGQGDWLLQQACDAAKAQNITVWTIAFETTSHGEQVMRQCASSSAHYFEADGTDLSSIFAAIGRSIKQVRLTQ